MFGAVLGLALLGVTLCTAPAQAQANTSRPTLGLKASAGWGAPGQVWFGVSQAALGGQVSAALSNQAAELGYERSLTLPLGAATTSVQAARPWSGGLRIQTDGTATLGPVALDWRGAAFSAAPQATDPLAPWAWESDDLRPQGWRTDASVRYRLSRNLIAGVRGELGGQPGAEAWAEGLRVVTARPPAQPTGVAPEDNAGDDTEDNASTLPPEPLDPERLGQLRWQLGARVSPGLTGALLGVRYQSERGWNAEVGAQLGITDGVTSGVRGSAGLRARAELPEWQGWSTQVYAVYEPWRRDAAWRAGLGAERALGPGTLSAQVQGGSWGERSGLGLRLGYRVDLGAVGGEMGEETQP